MSQKHRRRKPKKGHRLAPCFFCGYPISERHHALPVAVFGENSCTLQLCANCHELYHLVQSVYMNKSRSAARLLQAFVTAFGEQDPRLQKSYHFIAAAIRIAAGESE